MTCHTFKVLRQIYGDKFWSAPELTPQRSLRLAPSFCLATVAWGACIVQGPSWWLMNWLHPSSWLKRNGWAHRTRTGTLTCRVTLKVHVFELLSHPAFWHSQFIQKTSIKCTSSWPFFWQTLWLCGIVSHLNIFKMLWWVGLFANCGVMTCHTFKVLRQIYGDKFWSAPELTPQRSLRLAPSFCLASVAWGACIVQGPSWWLMNWLHPSSWLKRNGWAHGTRTGTLTCRVTLKVHVFELLSHPAFWHSQFIQKTSIKWTGSWPFLWLTLWLCGIVSHWIFSYCLDVLDFLPTVGVMTCHTFKVLRQIYGDKFWSAPELTPQKSLRLFLVPLGAVSLLLEVPKCMYPTSTPCEQALMWLWRQPRWHWLPGDLSSPAS